MDEKGMKTLEEVIQAALDDANEAINPDGTGLSESDIAQFVSRAVRAWMREQNEGLKEVITDTLNKHSPFVGGEIPYTASAILSVIPPRMIYDPRPLQAEINGWKTAARIVELEDLCGEYSNKLTEVKALLDKLRPIRSAQESRIQQTKTHISNGIKTGNGHYIDQADSVLSEFLDEMQKAKAIHAEIDSIIEKVQISQMEEQRKEFDSGGISPAEADDLNAIRQKAHAYTALREKFPFLPGEYFYALFNDRIRRFECENILVGGAYLLGKDRGGTTINFRPDQCYATLQELKDKLEVVE